MSQSKLNAAFVRALEAGKGRDYASDAYTFIFLTKQPLYGQPFKEAAINQMSDTIYIARASRAGVEAVMKDSRVQAMELSRTLFAAVPNAAPTPTPPKP
jgi:hypothetical protein